ncbi:hypothetical protein BKI52_16760 [marine bacterium AO1-C]|nr:hypothetical protein BKI52_16760 [marine bacterium AO1-C]
MSWPFWHFLAIYASLILGMTFGLVFWSRYLRKVYYKKALSQKIKISNPLQVAYLKNGLRGYIRTILFKLIRQNYLEVPRKGWKGYRIKSKAGHPSIKLLSKEEQTVYHYAVSQGNWEKVINYKELHEDLRLVAEDADSQLTNYSLLYPQSIINRLNQIRAFFMLIVLSLGAYRYFGGIKLKAHSWSLLAVGLVGMMLILHLARLNRVTKQGRMYLMTLKKRYDKPKSSINDQHQLVKVSLLKDNKQAMQVIQRLLKEQAKKDEVRETQVRPKMRSNLGLVTSSNARLET